MLRTCSSKDENDVIKIVMESKPEGEEELEG